MPKRSAGAILALAICSLPLYAQEGSVTLSFCNVGAVAIDVFVTKQGQVESSNNIAPFKCTPVYQDIGSPQPAHVGFGFVDSSGKWGAAHRLDRIPVIGDEALSMADENQPGLSPGAPRVVVTHGNSKVSLPMQLLFRPANPTCRQSAVPYYGPGAVQRARAEAEAARTPPTCENVAFSYNVMAYPDSHEITFLDEPQAPPRSRRVDWSNLNAYLGHLYDIRGDIEQKIIDRHVVIRATVSRVEVSLPGAAEPMVNVYFSESADIKTVLGFGEGSIVSAYSYRPDIFQEMFGPSFRASMIGKTLEVEGEIIQSVGGSVFHGEIEVTLAHQLRVNFAPTTAADRAVQEALRQELEEAHRAVMEKGAREYAKAQAKQDSFRRSVADYDPKWVGQELIVKGTVSRVEVKPAPPNPNKGPSQVATLYFRESPDGAFVVCQETSTGVIAVIMKQGEQWVGVHMEFSELSGKTIEVTGKVMHSLAAPAPPAPGYTAQAAAAAWSATAMDRRCPPNSAGISYMLKTQVFTEGKTPEPPGSKGPSPVSANPERVPTPGQPVQQASSRTTPAPPLPPPSTRPPVQPASARGAPVQAVPPVPSAAGLDAIIELVKGGMSEALVIKTIQRQGKAYDLTQADLVRLHQAGVSEKIIEAMLDSTAASGASPSAAVPSQQGKSSPAPGQATAPATAAPDNSDAAAAQAKAFEDQRDRVAQQRSAAQQQAKQRAEEAQKRAQRTAACVQQVTKAHPDAGRRDPNVSKEILACIQAQ